MDDSEMFAPEEAAALGSKGRRQMRWVSAHRDLDEVLRGLRQRFGERHAGASIDAVGDAFRYHVYVRDLTEQEGDEVRAAMGEAAEHVELVGVRYSTDDLRRIMAEVGDFVRTRPESDAYSTAAVLISPNAVEVVIREDATALWEAVRERFGDAVVVRWGVVRYSHAPGPPEWDAQKGLWRIRG